MMKFRLLGPLEIRVDDDWRGIGAPKWRAVLAALLISSGHVVSTGTLISEVWGDDEPAKAANLVSIYVLRLRRLLGDKDGTVLVTRSPGYQLRLGPDDTDVQVFESMVRDGRRSLAAGDCAKAAQQLAEALALWRGSALADVPRSDLVAAEADRLAELRLDAAELRVTAELACGGHAEAVPELRRLLATHPLREGLWVLLMRALNGSGRHAEALDAYGQARAVIADELGVDPGPELRRLYAELLAEDAAADTAGPAGVIAAGTVHVGPAGGAPATVVSASPGQAEASETVTSIPAAASDAAESQASAAPDATPRPPVAERRSMRRPQQLPADVADFTGREDQVNRLCDLLSASSGGASGPVRIALVAGYGGLGKTSLAVHAAHQVCGGTFPDGQLYVDLLGATSLPLHATDVLARFLRDLGIDGKDIPHDEAERAARYRTALAGRRVLVVLDNAKDAAQVRPLLPGSGSCAVLITTRNRMPDLASTRLVDLDVLDDDDALTLFTKVVDDKRAAAEPEATAEVLLACAGLPLAIRICAARLATRSGWSISTMAGRLRDERRRLDELRVGDLAVRASFEVSFASLPPARAASAVDPARTFSLLGLWHGPTISTAAAAALLGTSDLDAGDALELLVDAHLLESKSPDRYKFHDLLRVYASERATADLPEADRTAAITRLLTWYMRTADEASKVVSPYRYDILIEGDAHLRFESAEAALRWYDSERANLVAATSQAAAAGLHEVAWRLVAPLFSIFHRRDNWPDCITTHRIALDSARAAGNRAGEAWVLNNLGDALGKTRDGAAVGYLEESVAIRREIGDKAGEAQSVNNLADAFETLGRLPEAQDLLRHALELNREVGNRSGEGAALVNLGSVLLRLDLADEAAVQLQAARQVFDEIGNIDGIGYSLDCLGLCYLHQRRYPEALDTLRQALDIHRAAGSRHRQAATLRALGSAQAHSGLKEKARESWAEAAVIFEELGDTAQAGRLRAEHGDLS
jgi:DNA-binding SARP family transcriptional activator/Tfp pilus assembly protein PilF